MHTYPLFLLEPYTWCESSIMHHRRTSNIIIITLFFFRLLLYAVLFVLASAPSGPTITLSASSIS